ncbi:MAG: hydroxymethylbilane synthase [Candidatus Eisenbacteria bacterium]
MTDRRVRIGTRRSRLALWQSEWVAGLLREAWPGLEVDVVPVRTLGDKDRTTALHGMARQGVFTKELEEALLDERCDIAVHSMKDLPVRFPGGLRLAAVLEREDPRDALVSHGGRTLAELPEGGALGTSSLRRRSQILHLRPDLRTSDLRGNVPTRLRAVGIAAEKGETAPEPAFDATVLAYAGLRRLGLDHLVSEVLPVETVLPAPAQGAVAVEIRSDDRGAADLLRPLHHEETDRRVTAEREFLEALGGWCHVPVGALATIRDGAVDLEGFVGGPDGVTVLREKVEGEDPVETGRRLAEVLAERGATEILRKVLRGDFGDG